MEEISIQKLEAKDAVLLHEVAIKAYSDHYLDLWHDHGKWYIEKYFSVDKLTQELSDANAVFFIAYYNSKPIGFLKININATLEGEEDENALELERIYLNKEVTGKGIGRELVDLTFEIARKNNKKVVWLKAMDTSEGSIAFYKKMAFAITGIYRLKHPLMKEELRGMVIMAKRL